MKLYKYFFSSAECQDYIGDKIRHWPDLPNSKSKLLVQLLKNNASLYIGYKIVKAEICDEFNSLRIVEIIPYEVWIKDLEKMKILL